MDQATLSRRAFVLAAGSCLVPGAAQSAEPIIDLHQHTNYLGRSDAALVAHQRAMGARKTVLLPAGSKYGLAADCGGNETVLRLARRYPQEFAFFANELPDLPGARRVIERYLKAGAIGIGEQKFPVECDSPHILRLAELAREYDVPILMHFEHGAYNLGFDRFHRVLEKFPQVRFIGHAQTWWGNVDRHHDQKNTGYPKGQVTPGGITDRLLSNYPNVYGDLSAGSGLNALLRDEDQARGFLSRHQDKLLYGSDCTDPDAKGERCIGAKGIAAIQRLSPNQEVVRKILFGNARRVLKIKS